MIDPKDIKGWRLPSRNNFKYRFELLDGSTVFAPLGYILKSDSLTRFILEGSIPPTKPPKTLSVLHEEGQWEEGAEQIDNQP